MSVSPFSWHGDTSHWNPCQPLSERQGIFHIPASIPLHWQQQVRADLLWDEALEIVEKVPHGEPTQWCHRMVIARKHDGTPRQIVNLSPLNKFCRRETFALKTSFKLARRVAYQEILGKLWLTLGMDTIGFHYASQAVKGQLPHLFFNILKTRSQRGQIVLFEISIADQFFLIRLCSTINLYNLDHH